MLDLLVGIDRVIETFDSRPCRSTACQCSFTQLAVILGASPQLYERYRGTDVQRKNLDRWLLCSDYIWGSWKSIRLSTQWQYTPKSHKLWPQPTVIRNTFSRKNELMLPIKFELRITLCVYLCDLSWTPQSWGESDLDTVGECVGHVSCLSHATHPTA